MQYQRIPNILESNSFFLFGARGTGKSTLIKKLLPPSATLYIDLLKPTQERKLRDRPEELAEMLTHAQRTNPDFQWVVIDEVQKVPELLDVVHHLIESASIRFALTGSSARKLKRGGANRIDRARDVSLSIQNIFQVTSTNSFFDSIDAGRQWQHSKHCWESHCKKIHYPSRN